METIIIWAMIIAALLLIVLVSTYLQHLRFQRQEEHRHQEAMAASTAAVAPSQPLPTAQPRDDYEGYQAQSYYPPPGQHM